MNLLASERGRGATSARRLLSQIGAAKELDEAAGHRPDAPLANAGASGTFMWSNSPIRRDAEELGNTDFKAV